MKVETTTLNQVKTLAKMQKSADRPDNTVQGNAAGTKAEAFSIQISDKVKELMTEAPAEDQIRLDKVAAIREQLAKGNYNISGKDVADKILNALKS